MQCKAKSKQSKKRCRKQAIDGGTVCAMHGGKAPQVKRKAAERLRELEHPAIDRIAKTIENQDGDVPHAVSLTAARDILDRTGHKPPDKIHLSGELDLVQRLRAGRERAAKRNRNKR